MVLRDDSDLNRVRAGSWPPSLTIPGFVDLFCNVHTTHHLRHSLRRGDGLHCELVWHHCVLHLKLHLHSANHVRLDRLACLGLEGRREKEHRKKAALA